MPSYQRFSRKALRGLSTDHGWVVRTSDGVARVVEKLVGVSVNRESEIKATVAVGAKSQCSNLLAYLLDDEYVYEKSGNARKLKRSVVGVVPSQDQVGRESYRKQNSRADGEPGEECACLGLFGRWVDEVITQYGVCVCAAAESGAIERRVESWLSALRPSSVVAAAEREAAVDLQLGLAVALGAWFQPLQFNKGWPAVREYVLAAAIDPGPRVYVEADDRKTYPLKAHVAAATKVNMFFRDVAESARKYHARAWFAWQASSGATRGMANDEAAGWLVWFCAYYEQEPAVALAVLSRSQDHAWLKALSNMVKACGIGNDLRLAQLAELGALRGRGVAVPSLAEDLRYRLDGAAHERDISPQIPDDVLRACVRRILAQELGAPPVYETRDEAWSRRWSSTPSGSHAREVERRVFGHVVTGPQATKREFAETVSENMIAHGEPDVTIGQSWKLEEGKTRAIYATDTRCFYTFDYLLRPLERVFRNSSVLLSPAAEADTSRMKRLASRDTAYLMGDFDDFNSAHTLRAMVIVTEEAGRYCPDRGVVDWCVASLSRMSVRTGPGVWEAWEATLPSGHRATTFFNTILNAAYLMAVLGPLYERFNWLHAGDDVYTGGVSLDELGEVARVLRRSRLRMNASKQGLGRESAEFLRMSFNSSGGVGYLARAVATGLSGSWVKDAALSPREYLSSVCERAWTWTMRSGVRIGDLMYHTMLRRVPQLGHAWFKILTLRASLDGSPVFQAPHGVWEKYEVAWEREEYRVTRRLRGCATDEYLAKHVDWRAFKNLGLRPERLRQLMLEVSEPRELSVLPRVKRVSVTKCYAEGTMAVRGVPDTSEAGGVLGGAFPWTFLKGEMSIDFLRAVMAAAGVFAGVQNAYVLAWGARRESLNVVTPTPFSVAGMWGRTLGGEATLVVDFPLRK